MSIKYFTEVGSYRGCAKVGRSWVSVKNLNYVDKRGWLRHQGPPTPAMVNAMLNQPIDARNIKLALHWHE